MSRTAPSPVAPLLRGLRARLLVRTSLRSIGGAVAVAAATVALLLLVDALIGVPAEARRLLRWLPALVLCSALAPILHARRSSNDDRLALLVDERAGLGNVLSTYRAPNTSGPVATAFRARAEEALRGVRPSGIVQLDAGGPWGWAAGATLLAVLVVVGTSDGVSLQERWLAPQDVASAPLAERPDGTDPGAPPVPTLGALEIVVRPPAYTRFPETRFEGGTLSALPGTRISILGDGNARASDLVVTIAGAGVGGSDPSMGSTEVSGLAGSDGWGVAWTVGPDDRGLSIAVVADSSTLEQRVVPLRPMRDRAPSVTLHEPDDDLVLGSADATIPLRATALDDFGVETLTLHWVHSRGSGESFDFSEGTWTWDSVEPVDGGRAGRFLLNLAEQGLQPGDVLHIRATAEDGNDVTGPGIGVSSTRQIRISRDEDLADITTLAGFPIERDREPLLSQRMIILLTEELIESAGALSREALLEEAASIADEQARLRSRIGEQIFSRATGAMQDPESHLEFEHGDEHEPEVFLDELEAAVARGPVIDPETGIANIANVEIPMHDHDSDPIVAINRSLLTIYNYMWDAERLLRAATLDPSLVPQGFALDMLQELREAERIFPRGRVAVAPVDVAAVRGSGEGEDAEPAQRSPTSAAGTGVDDVLAVLDALLVGTSTVTGRAASVEISGLALDLLELRDDPGASEILVEAASLARTGEADDVRALLTAARRELRGAAPHTSSLRLDPPTSLAGARYLPAGGEPPPPTPATVPLTFATVRYESGDWDSAPLVPANLIHSLAQYTDLPLEPEGVVVDLSSADVFRYPFLYMTGHLPVFFNEAEGRNLVDFVERGGFIFIDDHNHDIDGAFHRSVTSELHRLFGQDRLQPLPNDHELYSSFFVFDDGPPITGHELSGWGDGLIHRELHHIEWGGRIGVLYSNKDYSSEWSYHAENKRFLAVDNTRFGVNILVYALTR